jgi:UDP-N-acetylglucosamine 2-epimerase
MHPDLQIVVPMHPNPAAGAVVQQLLGGIASIRLCRALPYSEFVKLLLAAKIALSDSGGIQEEGPALGLPVLVLREVTERPEGIAAGSVRLIGTETDRVVDAVHELLVDESLYRAMGTPRAVYGDGLASERIADVLVDGDMRRPAFASVVGAGAPSNA